MEYFARRQVLVALGALFAAPLAVRAQLAGKMPVVGIVITSPTHPHYETLKQAFRDLGYIEGKTVRLDWWFWEGKAQRLPQLIEELVRTNPDVILAITAPPALAVKRATSSIPVIFAAVGIDPVALGLVRNLARPDGNVTGLIHIAADLGGKQLETLREIAPKISPVAVLINPENANTSYFAGVDAAARSLGMEVFRVDVRETRDFDAAFAIARRRSAQGILVQPDPFLFAQRERISQFAARGRVPTVSAFNEEAEAGGLVSCGPSLFEHYRRAAQYVSKILRGAKPSELPVEQPLQIALTVNLRTAKTLGLTVPRTVLLRADRLIE